MKHARVAYAGALHTATEHHNGRLQLTDGRLVSENDVVWLSPVEPGTIIALGLNYAAHAKELSFGAQQEPLAFLKGPNSVLGHRGQTRRPQDASFMHYECELAVVIGCIAKQVSQAEAYDYVAGYSVANDYALRDYLENYYRPNLKVKNRDGCTVIGPWLVDKADIPDPHNLQLATFVNGKQTQTGNTADMVYKIPFLIEYLSHFMTLNPGDILLTGTPEGVIDVKPGDQIVTEIDGIGRLENTILADTDFKR